jgi:hypothetical protein
MQHHIYSRAFQSDFSDMLRPSGDTLKRLIKSIAENVFHHDNPLLEEAKQIIKNERISINHLAIYRYFIGCVTQFSLH